MLRIRLQRRGKRGYATYRVVVADGHAPIKGKFIEDLGHYNPHTNTFSVEADAIKAWIAKGAHPSDTVHNLLIKQGVLEGKKRDVLSHNRIKAKNLSKQGAIPVETA